MTKRSELVARLNDIVERLDRLDRENELMRTVLIVKEPETIQSANAYEGLRKQVIAAVAERRSHLGQLASMAVALQRAGSIDDLVPQVEEWLNQAGVVRMSSVPEGARAQDFFEDLDGVGIEGGQEIEIVEPAYVDQQTGIVLRLGRSRRARSDQTPPVTVTSENAAETVPATVPTEEAANTAPEEATNASSESDNDDSEGQQES